MEAVTLSDLGPIIAAVVGPMVLFVAASMRYQHLDSTKTRKMITDSEKAILQLVTHSNEKNRDLIDTATRKNRELIDRNRDLIDSTARENRDLIERLTRENRDLIERLASENRDLIMKNHAAISDVRERLARIEGHLAVPPRQGSDNDGDAQAA